jgi:poly(3-hydroxybutyrate) depolymerase
MKVRLAFCLVLLATCCAPTNAQTVVKPRRLAQATMLRTPAGIEFALVGTKGARPAPVLFVMGGPAQQIVEDESSNLVGWLLAKHGFLSVALDIPCHGKDRRPGEPEGMACWRARLEKGEALLSGFMSRLSSVIDFLVREGYADPARLGAAGPSRGGFMALHAAAVEPRLRYAVAFAPLTDLLALREFQGIADPAPARALDVMLLVDKLVDRPILVSIGHNDERVGTRHAMDFALRLMEISPLHKKPMTHFWSGDDIKLVVTPSEGASGHSSYRTAHDEAADWILRYSGK